MDELLKRYKAGGMDKKEFSDQMMQFHKVLMQYASLVENAGCLQSIEIAGGVCQPAGC